MTTETMTDPLATASTTIIIPAGRYQAALVNYVERGLADIATVAELTHGNVAVISRRPVASFSRSEQLLWSLLDDLVKGQLAALLEVSDAMTLSPIGDLFARLTFATFS